MLVIGQGGTGKSVLIDAITETFIYHRELSALAKCATSGVAATHIGGSTVHNWAGLGIQRLKTMSGSKAIVARRKRNILKKKCLIIDEMSMLYDTLLADIAKVVAHTKKAGQEGNEHLPFAGLNVILMGDFHQFPPVGKPYSALYSRQNTKDPDALQGRALYRQFDNVVWLQEQIRVKDEVWTGILSRLRIGRCTEEDIRTIRGLILNSRDCPQTDFTCLPWSEAVLVTTRHTVREAWNAARLKQHCRKTGNRRYIVSSEDYNFRTGAPLTNNVRLEVAKLNERKTKTLSDRIEIAIGMKAMIVVNLSTEGDVANGTRGTITAIILDPREQRSEPDEEGAIRLMYPPAMILFEPDGGSQISSAFVDARVQHGINIPKGQIPLTPCATNFTVTMPDGTKLSIGRRQYALTGGYAFTDIKSQGQTIEYLIVDLRNTPTGKISPFSAYVALSRSRGRGTIRLLSDFDDTLFRTHPNADLEAEMQRLRILAAKLS